MKHLSTFALFESARVIAAATAILDGNKVLILKRGDDAPWEPGKWNLPGGIVEDGETPEEAAIREAQEECGLTPAGLTLISKHNKDDWSVEFYRSDKYTGELKVSDECPAHKWVTAQELDKYEFVPFVKPMLKKLLVQKFESLEDFGSAMSEKKVYVSQKEDEAVFAFNEAGPMKIANRWMLYLDKDKDMPVGSAFINMNISKNLSLRELEVAKGMHNHGIGTKFMEQLCAAADKNGWTIVLTPDSYKGSSVTRLKEFYSRFGFVMNKGRKKDWSISELMYRRPNI